MYKEKYIIDNVYCNSKVLNLCKLWLEHLKKERLLSDNTYNAYSIDLKYFLKFLSNHLSNKVNIQNLENLSLRDFREISSFLSRGGGVKKIIWARMLKNLHGPQKHPPILF